MKRNFLKVAALLIAAMLMVVSCTQEVAPKNEGNELVEVRIGVGRSSRDISVVDTDTKTITYKYTLTPEWTMVNNGTPIYGAVEDEATLAENCSIAESVNDVELGLVTPGLWKISVFGYMDGVKVLEGVSTAYFTGDKTPKTVFVSPVSNKNGSGTVNITLSMQDLDDGLNNISYTIQTLGLSEAEDGKVTGEITSPQISGNIGTYVASNISVKAGFNTLTLSIPGKAGGITTTFLMVPGREVTVTGSVYPSDFVESHVKVSVIDLSGAELTVNASKTDVPVSSDPDAEKVSMYVLEYNGNYTFEYKEITTLATLINSVVNNSEGKAVVNNVQRGYQWYVGSKDVPNATSSTVTLEGLGINETPGDYAITCVVTYTFSINGESYKILASATEGKVRVSESTN